VTVGLWIIMFAIRLVISHFDPTSALLTWFDIGLSLLVQRYYVWHLAGKEFSQEIENNRKFNKK